MPVPPKVYMTPEELSKIIEDGELSTPHRKSIWSKLIGKIIACPICNGKAVMVPFGMDIPVEKHYNAPCHCSIGLSTGDIIYHWCVNDDHSSERSKYYPFCYVTYYDMKNMSVDVCSAVEIFMKRSHKV